MYDVIVIGVGSMGISACYYLSGKGVKVLGLDQFSVPHTKGGHNGQSRIIRKAYFEHPGYVPLLQRAYQLWNELEHIAGIQLFFKTGLVYFGKSDHPVIEGVRSSAQQYNIELETIDTTEQFEQFRIPGNYAGIFEPNAGFVSPEESITTYQSLAEENGASIHLNEKVLSWEKKGPAIIVKTNKTVYETKKLIITAGPWTKKILPQISQKLKITRQVIAWINPANEDDYVLGRFPCWMIADDQPGVYYGFPVLPGAKFGEPSGLKIAHHTPGIETDPDEAARPIKKNDLEYIHYVLDKYLPGAKGEIVATSTCLYDNSDDENFLIDFLPGHDDVIFAAGFSGHGFKFIPVIGEILSELAISGKSELPITFLHYR